MRDDLSQSSEVKTSSFLLEFQALSGRPGLQTGGTNADFQLLVYFPYKPRVKRLRGV